MSSEKPKVYHITTLSGFLAIPPDRLGDCLAEFKTFLEIFRAAQEIAKEAGIEIGFPIYRWIDDGKQDVKVSVTVGKELP